MRWLKAYNEQHTSSGRNVGFYGLDLYSLSSSINARLVTNAERYYRTMYYAESNSWNQRDQHMFETLQSVLAFRGPQAKAVIWEHNSHIGDARATEMSARGEFNIGQLARQQYGNDAYLIGFGTDHGTVAAASERGRPHGDQTGTTVAYRQLPTRLPRSAYR
jgi:erythromycin esterase-like protein